MKPTALHTVTSTRFRVVVFKHTGVTVHAAAKEEDNVLPAGTWALADSSESNKQPCPTFLCASTQRQAWIVQTTLPAKDRWYQWSKEFQAGFFVMDCFTYDELIAPGMILGLDLDRFREQIELWGSSTARTCVVLTRDPERTSHLIRLATNAAQKFAEKPNDFDGL
ncbi:hypothetical protein BJV78DRAFT_1174790 [Lactifluus subvellereus]|nr:hypothetical protein BJV78DRAFT_1174790 [Lactifluus subvellereus]